MKNRAQIGDDWKKKNKNEQNMQWISSKTIKEQMNSYFFCSPQLLRDLIDN